MTDLFLKILNLSISGSYLVAAVVLLRLILKKAPRWVWPMLWGVVALRLILPVSIESRVSMIPDRPPVTRDAIVAYAPPLTFETPAQHQVNTVNAAQNRNVEVKTELGPDQVMALVWLAGVAGMLLYTGASYWGLRRRVGRAARLQKNIFESRNVASPFVLGLFRPRIYLPLGLSQEDRFYILAHEEAHIRRRDHIWKTLGFCLLALHWFNPLMWLAYILLCRDIELACDEKVIKQMGREGRADYSQALLSCAIRHRTIAACPLAFGEVGVKQRVKSVLSYKKPAFWVVLLAVVASVVVAVCFLTNPKQAEKGRLTLDDVLALAEKSEITEADLEGYEFEHDHGEPLYIYPMEENFEFWVYKAEGNMRVFQLHCNAGEAGDGHVNITDRANLEEFLALHNQPLDEGWDGHWKIALDVDNSTPTGTRVLVSHYHERDGMKLGLQCEEDYTLWKKGRRGDWEELPQKVAPTQGGETSEPTELYVQALDWTERYGALPDGEYQIRKWVLWTYAGVSIGREFAADFIVSVDGKPQLTAEEFLNRKKFEDESFYSKIQTREEYNAKHRNTWADFEDFAYVEMNSDTPITGWRRRCYLLDNGLFMYMNGDRDGERPNNIGLSNGIDGEWIMTDWVDSRETLAFAMDLISQPLAPGQQSHFSAQLAVDSCSPTGATLILETTQPEKVVIQPESICYLEQLDEDGSWIPVPTLDGDSTGGINFPASGPRTIVWDWQHGALPPGTYRIRLEVRVLYDNGEEPQYLGLMNMEDLKASFAIGESQAETMAPQAMPFEPGEIHDLTQAVLCIQDAEYVITDEEDLAYLEALLSSAKPEKGIPGCPFNNSTYLVREDGAVFSFRHAEDSCTALEAGTDYYSYDLGLGQDFWSVFGIAQYYVQADYDDQGRVVQWDEYEWGRRVPNSTTKFTYDHAGNLFMEERIADDGTTIRKKVFAYDDRGNQVAWWNYDGDTLWSRGEREFDEKNNLVKETSYQGDVLYLGTAYTHDDRGRILEAITTVEGEPSSTARYEWSDDHHYRVYNYTPEGDLRHSTAYVTDEEGRIIRQEFFSQYGGSEGAEEYEYVDGNDKQMIVRYYDKNGNLTEEGWRNID